MGDEFYSILKLVSGEEIFALVCVDESDDNPILILHNPIKMKPLHPQSNQLSYIKVTPWMDMSDEDMFVLKMDKIITMTEVKNEQMIQFYDRYLSDDDFDFEIDGRVNLSNHMGLLSTVEDARKRLEEIFKIPSNNKEI